LASPRWTGPLTYTLAALELIQNEV
jgi:hypothetical protein